MAALIDNSLSANTAAAATTYESASFTVSGSNRVLYVFVASGAGTPVAPTSVKWGGTGGVALTQLSTTITVPAAGAGRHSVWRLIAPASGASTVFVTWSAGQDEAFIVIVSVKDAHQTTPEGTIAQATQANSYAPTVNATTVSGDLVIDNCFFISSNTDNKTFTVGSGQTLITKQDGNALVTGGYEGISSSSETATTTSTTMSYSIGGSASNIDTSIFAFAVNAAGAAPSTSYKMARRNVELLLHF